VFNIFDRVTVLVEGIRRIGWVEAVNVSPLKLVTYSVGFPFSTEDIEFTEAELTLYTNPHISSSFSRSSN